MPGSALTVDQLAQIDLVSGAGGYTTGTRCAVNGVTNLFTGYTGDEAAANGGYTAPTAGSDSVQPGAGFFWYLFGENNPNPNFPTSCSDGTNTSTAMALPNGLPFTPTATEADATVAVTGRAANDDAFFLGGNPFTQDLDLEGDGLGLTSITASGGAAFSNVVQAYNPAGGYTLITAQADTGDDGSGGTATADNVSVWQGFFLEALDPNATVGTITYESDFRTGSSGAVPFVGRSASSGLAQVRLALSGTLDGGATVADDAIGVVFAEGSTAGWDGYDASKLDPFGVDYAELALLGAGRDGDVVAKASDSYSLDAQGDVVIPARFTASAAGLFELSWTAASFPAGWTAALRDTETGAESDLTVDGTYAFDAAADAGERFEITVTPLLVAGESSPEAVTLSALAPNPTAGVARMSLTVSQSEAVSVQVFDALGRRVATVLDDAVAAGATRVVSVPTAALAPGVYVVRVQGDTFAETRRLTVTR